MSNEKDQGNVARGLKAAINNPRVSDSAKEHDRERLREMGEQVPGDDTQSGSAPRSGVKGSKPRATRRRAPGGAAAEYDELEEYGDEYEGEPEEGSAGREATAELNDNQIRGYKATLKNPRVSEGAKDHARELLEENNAL